MLSTKFADKFTVLYQNFRSAMDNQRLKKTAVIRRKRKEKLQKIKMIWG